MTKLTIPHGPQFGDEQAQRIAKFAFFLSFPQVNLLKIIYCWVCVFYYYFFLYFVGELIFFFAENLNPCQKYYVFAPNPKNVKMIDNGHIKKVPVIQKQYEICIKTIYQLNLELHIPRKRFYSSAFTT